MDAIRSPSHFMFFLILSAVGVLFASIISSGWGALLSGILAYTLEIPPTVLLLCSTVGGFLGDRFLAKSGQIVLSDNDASTRERLITELYSFSPFIGLGLQSTHLFRRDWVRLLTRSGTFETSQLVLLAIGSLIGASTGVAIVYTALTHYFGAWDPVATRPILPGLILLALLVSETWRIVLERLIQRYYESHHHENSAH